MKIAQLTNEQKNSLTEFEKKLGVILVAYDQDHDVTDHRASFQSHIPGFSR